MINIKRVKCAVILLFFAFAMFNIGSINTIAKSNIKTITITEGTDSEARKVHKQLLKSKSFKLLVRTKL